MKAPQASILIPAYNERFFGEAFASARAQTFETLEIVVCDDSPGTVIEATVRAASADERVRYVRNPERRGFEGNFTECLRQARGEFVKFLNDDDRLRPDCVARHVQAFREIPGLKLCTSRRGVIDDRGREMPPLPPTVPIAHVSCLMAGEDLGNFVLVNSANVIGEPTTVTFRKSDLAPEAPGIFTWGGRGYHCLADLSLWLRLLAHGPAYYWSAPLSDFRVHAGQQQQGCDMDVQCFEERLALVREARRAGFLRGAWQFDRALERIGAMAQQLLGQPAYNARQRASLEALSASVLAERAAPAGR